LTNNPVIDASRVACSKGCIETYKVCKDKEEQAERDKKKQDAAKAAEYDKLKAKAIEERKKITCMPTQGNVQKCVQHGQDLLSAEKH